MGLFNKLLRSKEPAPTCAVHTDDKGLIKPDDLVWWDSLSLKDCQAFEKQDSIAQVAALIDFVETERLPEAEAAKKVRLSFPFFYWRLEQRADEKFRLGADDAKLPYVLKGRINRMMLKRAFTDKRGLKRELEQASSYNALVRQLIRSGRI